MRRRLFMLLAVLSTLSIESYVTLAKVANATGPGAAAGSGAQGSLRATNSERGPLAAECPLKHTDVKAEISGFLSRVVVTQEFENPFKDKIEAVYTFPLPQNAAVDDMTMRVGERVVRGAVRRRDEALLIYDAARNAGNIATLLNQERPNIFTQSVANIMPGEKVTVTISYVATMKYEDGSYEFVFPMVVAPRYIPAQPAAGGGEAAGAAGPQANAAAARAGTARVTPQVNDGSRISPPVMPGGMRAGHDISIEVALDAGVRIDAIRSSSHELDLERPTTHSAVARLKNRAEIPNKDFILRYDVSGRGVEDGVLAHRSPRGNLTSGFFMMILQPPGRVNAKDVTPKEIVFVLDTSGSMSGRPIEKAKEAMRFALDGLYPQDTFNLITFSGDTSILFPEPVPATKENLLAAQEFMASREGSGGTEMMKAIRAALDPSDAKDHIRIVCFMTDGAVGNDREIISEVQKHQNARVFSFGIGGSVNRFLLDKMAEEGRGDVEYVGLNDDGAAAAKRFYERVRNPLLTDISIDWGGLPVADIYPKAAPDLFGAKPVVLYGRYAGGGSGVVKLKGKMAGRDWAREIPVTLPGNEPRHDVLATLWARTRIDDLMSQVYYGIQRGSVRPDLVEAITQLALDYRLTTQFTTFVAVEEMALTDGGGPRRVEVPVEVPEGMSHRSISANVMQEYSLASMVFMNFRVSATAPPPPSPGAPARAAPDTGAAGKDRSAAGTGPAQAGVYGMAGVPPGAARTAPGNPPSPEEKRRQQLLIKLHPSIVAFIERAKTDDADAPAADAKFVGQGKAEVQVWLTDKSPEVILLLMRLGFEVVLEPKVAKAVIGRIPVENLAALAELGAVRYVAPAAGN
ncbi:MAG: VIT and vWA domain-containing protein [Blastocatellia bacterium]